MPTISFREQHAQRSSMRTHIAHEACSAGVHSECSRSTRNPSSRVLHLVSLHRRLYCQAETDGFVDDRKQGSELHDEHGITLHVHDLYLAWISTTPHHPCQRCSAVNLRALLTPDRCNRGHSCMQVEDAAGRMQKGVCPSFNQHGAIFIRCFKSRIRLRNASEE